MTLLMVNYIKSKIQSDKERSNGKRHVNASSPILVNGVSKTPNNSIIGWGHF